MNIRYTLIAIFVFTTTCFITSIATAQVTKEAQAEETQEAQEADQTPEQKVEQAYRAFHEGILSDDEDTRLAALNKILPTRADFVLVLGEDITEKIWESAEKRLVAMREHNAEVKQEFERRGDLRAVKVANGRAVEHFAEQLSIVPERFPVFDINARTATGSAGSRSYVIIEDRVVFIRDLDSVKSYLKHLEEETGE